LKIKNTTLPVDFLSAKLSTGKSAIIIKFATNY